jgi:hypothetical protein
MSTQFARPIASPPIFRADPSAGLPSCAVIVKGADFTPTWNTLHTIEEQLGIGQRERAIEDKKTRTLEHHKGAAPTVQ